MWTAFEFPALSGLHPEYVNVIKWSLASETQMDVTNDIIPLWANSASVGTPAQLDTVSSVNDTPSCK